MYLHLSVRDFMSLYGETEPVILDNLSRNDSEELNSRAFFHSKCILQSKSRRVQCTGHVHKLIYIHVSTLIGS